MLHRKSLLTNRNLCFKCLWYQRIWRERLSEFINKQRIKDNLPKNMQFTPKEARKRTIKLEPGRDPDQYPHILQFYSVPPTDNISLQEFEDLAIERLKVLKAVENVGVKHVRGSNDWTEHMGKEFQNFKENGVLKALTDTKVPVAEVFDERRKDHISHFILRLAYCRSEELRRWFITQELDMFRYRFRLESNKSIKKFLDDNKLDYTPIPESEKKEVFKHLIDSAGYRKPVQVSDENFYKVPFTEALDLVRSRRVYLSKGYAYVPQSELVVIILSHFRTNLSHALAVTARALPNLEEDGRLLPMLNNLSKRYLGQDYDSKKIRTGEVTADMVDGLAKKDFPLCMQHLHQNMRANHHLRHHGRQQYGLFLKGIGLTLEEAMRFWKTEFTKIIDGDKFDKQYSYNIRHNYGKEGGRKNYTPMNCLRIITTNTPGVGDHHGCPFRHHDIDMLRQKLQSMNITKTDVNEVSDLAKKGHYQLACGRYFEITHNAERDSISINHPNEYFDLTRKEATKPEAAANNTPKTTPVIIKSKSRIQKSTSGDDFGDDISLTLEDAELAMQSIE